MSKAVAQLLEGLTEDPWRDRVGFSDSVNDANNRLFSPEISEAHSIEVVNEWLQHHQPCLFGLIAARLGLISYCLLAEADLMESDQFISDKIQAARSQWTAKGFEGRKSAFIVLAISSKVVNARPDRVMKELAQRLCSLYLQQRIRTDKIYLDNIFLEKQGRKTTAWIWPTGVNYFCSQGDKRWWQDHRIPGGMAFSVNSVGHMVKSGIMAKSMSELEHLLGAPSEDWALSKVDSLEKALQLAMGTIARASNAVSGKATELLPKPHGGSMKCPARLPTGLTDKNCREYRGYYHTDFTLPSEYFLPDVKRPEGLKVHTLDFTYLFDRRLDNPDFFLIGEGRRIRDGRSTSKPKDGILSGKVEKRRRGVARSIYISREKRLVEALRRSGTPRT